MTNNGARKPVPDLLNLYDEFFPRRKIASRRPGR